MNNEINIPMEFFHLRHATSILKIGEARILIDPMFAYKESLPPIPLSHNKSKNPGVDLPVTTDRILHESDHVLITHTHFDHFDKRAMAEIPKDKPVIITKTDKKKLKNMGFSSVIVADEGIETGGIKFTAFPAVHGRGILKLLMGKGSSFLLEMNSYKVFITGDSVFTNELKNNLIHIKPDIVVVNGGSASFRFGKPITMSVNDVKEISTILPESKIILVHLDSINHCGESGEFCLLQTKHQSNIIIPRNGEKIVISDTTILY